MVGVERGVCVMRWGISAGGVVGSCVVIVSCVAFLLRVMYCMLCASFILCLECRRRVLFIACACIVSSTSGVYVGSSCRIPGSCSSSWFWSSVWCLWSMLHSVRPVLCSVLFHSFCSSLDSGVRVFTIGNSPCGGFWLVMWVCNASVVRRFSIVLM